ncbi:MAG: hypothetical protein J0J01_28190 [Reyranella sp.]|uniref:hypothetical protein n=1 Tax=Reyranella sp. TaxID=1929291 RepID=UPI001AC3144C|nr:hypothetical protein [Reyranella sp.]MBN9090812.1 hypothetical protein [Reyranella sp.]
MPVAVLTIDSATKLPPEADGAVVVTGSHGAVYAAYLSAKAGVRGAIHHDAGIGLQEAGVGGLAYAETLGLAMAAIATESARIGDAADLLARGVISRANVPAATCGIVAGMTCREAVERLKQAPWPHSAPPPQAEGRYEVDGILCLDSASMLGPDDHDRVAATGSHGALIAGTTTAPMRPRLILFNDAGPGIERAGIQGLAVLEQAGVAAVAVAARSARIGDGRSTLQDGTISAVNRPASGLGARVDDPALELARRVAEKAP